MNTDWLKDGRKIPDEVMFYIRRMAVYAVRVRGKSPEIVADFYNFDRTCIYRWLNQYDEGGFEALESKMPPGIKPIIDEKVEKWLRVTILESTPVKFGYDTNLWTCDILKNLLKQEFDIDVSDSTVRLHLKAMNLSFQKSEYQDIKINENEVDKLLLIS